MKCPDCKIEMDRHDRVVRDIYQESIYICPKCHKTGGGLTRLVHENEQGGTT